MALPLEKLERTHEILARISEGGMGTVYKVRHRLLEELRAAKVMKAGLSDDEELKARFMIEARTAASLRHPNIAILYDFRVESDGTGVILMEYIDGVTLQQAVTHGGPISLPLALVIAEQTLSALDYLHSEGLVHRDIAPDNVMVTLRGGQPLVKLIDLGIAKALEEKRDLTASGRFLGKVRYASPELLQPNEQVDPRSDLYSFGVVFYQLLTGEYPVEGHDIKSLIAGHLWGPVRGFEDTDPGGRIPQTLRDLVLETLQKDPAARPDSAREVLDRLRPLRQDFDTSQNAQALQSIITGTAADPDARLVGSRGSTLRGQGDADRTERAFGNQGGLAFDQLLEQANECLQLKEYARARTLATEALAVHPASHRARMLLTAAEMSERRLEASRALAGIEALIEEDRLADAFAELVKWRSQYPNDERFKSLASRLDAATEDHSKAREQEQDRRRQVEQVLDRAHAALTQARYEDARHAVGEVLDIEPNNESARALRASIEAAAREVENTERAGELEKAISERVVQGENSQVDLMLEQIAELVDKDTFEEMRVRIKDGQLQKHLAEGRRQLDLGAPGEARQSLLEALAIDPQHTVAEQLAIEVDEVIQERQALLNELMDRGAEHRSSGALADALTIYEQILGMQPQNDEVQRAAVEVQQLITEAKERKQKVESHLAASEDLARTGQLKQALKATTAALEVDPDSTFAQQQLESIQHLIEDERIAAERRNQFLAFEKEVATCLSSNIESARRMIDSSPAEIREATGYTELAARVDAHERSLRRLLDQASSQILDDRLEAASETLDEVLATSPTNARAIRLRARVDRFLGDREKRIELDDAVLHEVEALRASQTNDLDRAEFALQTAIAKHGPHPLFDELQEELVEQMTEERLDQAEALMAETRNHLHNSRLEEAAAVLRRLESLDLPAETEVKLTELHDRYLEKSKEADTQRALGDTVTEIDRLLSINDLDAADEALRLARERFGDVPDLEPAEIALECLTGQGRRVQIEQVEIEVRDRLAAGDASSAIEELERGQSTLGPDPTITTLRTQIREALEEAHRLHGEGDAESPAEEMAKTLHPLASEQPTLHIPVQPQSQPTPENDVTQHTPISELATIETTLETAVGAGDLASARSILDALSPDQQLTLGSFKVRLEELEDDFKLRQVSMLRAQTQEQREAGDLAGALRSLREALALTPDDGDLTTEIHWLQSELRARKAASARTHRLGAEIVVIEELWNKGRIRKALKHLEVTGRRLDAAADLAPLKLKLEADQPGPLRDARVWAAAALCFLTIAIGFVLGSQFGGPTPPSAELLIDALPWAEVTGIDGPDGSRVSLGDDRSTPLRIVLPAGSYAIALKGPIGTETELEVELPEGGASVVHTFKRYSVESFLEVLDASSRPDRSPSSQ